MLARDIDRICKAYLAEALRPAGFSCDGTRHATFFRRLQSGIVHVVMPDPMKSGRHLDVKVFASSPQIDPEFERRFPDSLGIPFDSYCYLNRHTGIGSEQQSFRCETSEQLEASLQAEVVPLLRKHALPTLDRIQSMESLFPHLKNRMSIGFAHHVLGRSAEARAVLEGERLRLLPALPSDKTGQIARALERIDEALA